MRRQRGIEQQMIEAHRAGADIRVRVQEFTPHGQQQALYRDYRVFINHPDGRTENLKRHWLNAMPAHSWKDLQAGGIGAAFCDTHYK
ncbi:unnamed protein product [Vitrella brassicaformis CCMP3155]|uniref:Uncharacterized protein n=2 Tax=Vitrella brassicaformis TaxID=1169539 RepID=A0A0G4G5W3_VITBC|nr:unnamed protein product [Vitrella brassicaformis CCMP3155]|eukprot:CEM23914.1 unnamed protein product [Vitrella brassicaformis CCMP3155]